MHDLEEIIQSAAKGNLGVKKVEAASKNPEISPIIVFFQYTKNNMTND
jgi:hypothetical protein